MTSMFLKDGHLTLTTISSISIISPMVQLNAKKVNIKLQSTLMAKQETYVAALANAKRIAVTANFQNTEEVEPSNDTQIFAEAWSQAWSSRNADQVLELYSENIIFSSTASSTTLSGSTDFKHYLNNLFSIYPNTKVSLIEVKNFSEEHRLFIRWKGSVPILNDERTVIELDGISLLTLEENKIVSEQSYYDWLPIASATSLMSKIVVSNIDYRKEVDIESSLRQQVEAWDNGDVDRILGGCSQNILFRDSANPEGITTKTLLRQYLEKLFEDNPKMKFELVQIERLAKCNEAMLLWTGRIPEFDRIVSVDIATFIAFDYEGLIDVYESYYDQMRMFSLD